MKSLSLSVLLFLLPFFHLQAQTGSLNLLYSLPLQKAAIGNDENIVQKKPGVIDLASMNIHKGDPYKPPVGSLICLYLAGMADGTVEILRHDYDNFKKVFPKANDNYWNSEISWKNKWKDGDPAKGEKYFQSAYMLAWTTDGYHLLRSANKALICGAVILKIGDKKRPFLYYLYDFALCSASYTAGFTTTYSLIFKH